MIIKIFKNDKNLLNRLIINVKHYSASKIKYRYNLLTTNIKNLSNSNYKDCSFFVSISLSYIDSPVLRHSIYGFNYKNI